MATLVGLREKRAVDAHLQFRRDGVVATDALAAVVENSWRRSCALGLSVSDRPDYAPLSPSSLDALVEGNELLWDRAQPVMETLSEQIAGTESMVILTDARGIILRSIGDHRFLERAAKVALRDGVDWSELSKGTNAIGTAIFEKKSIVVHGPEHFLSVNHFLTCSASPIMHPNGELAGVLDVTGDRRGYHPHTLALVRMSAQLIENLVFARSFPDALIIHFHQRPEFIGTLAEGIAAFSSDGRLIAANPRGLAELYRGDRGSRRGTFSELFSAPLSTLFDHARKPYGHAAIPLTAHTGVRLWAAASLGERIARPSFVTESPATRQTLSGGAVKRKTNAVAALTLADLDTGDAQMAQTVAKARRLAAHDIAMLIEGETGTGKECLARAIHHASARAQRRFVAVNCSSIPEALLDVELFGCDKSAQIGAPGDSVIGKIFQANGGTLFLNNVDDLSRAAQARLLRVLQEKLVNPLGSSRFVAVDVLIIAATRKKLRESTALGQFREDLYYRLNGYLLQLPPLRQRTDLAQLIDQVLRHETGVARTLEVDRAVLELFKRHRWPGNCRELANLLRGALVLGDGIRIMREHLPADFLEELAPDASAVDADIDRSRSLLGFEHESLGRVEQHVIERAIVANHGNLSATARQLKISRNTLYRRLKQFDADVAKRRSPADADQGQPRTRAADGKTTPSLLLATRSE